MLQFKLKGGISLLDKVLAMTKEAVNRKKAQKKKKDQKKARKITRSAGKKKKKANPKGYVKPLTAEQRAKRLLKDRKANKPLKAARAEARKKK